MKTYFWFLSLFLLYTSCVREGNIDTEPPALEIIEWDPQPREAKICNTIEQSVFKLTDIDTLKAYVRISDEGGLSELKLDIHNNFDCHGHRSSTEDWFVQEIITLEGGLFEDWITITPPENVTSGAYHFGLQATDLSGNVTDRTLFYSIDIVNLSDTIPPTMEWIHPESSILEVERGDKIWLEGILRDNRNLNLGGNAGIEILSRRLPSGNNMTQHEVDLSDIHDTDYPFGYEFTVPMTWVRDEYELRIFAYDGVRNSAAPISIKLDVQ